MYNQFFIDNITTILNSFRILFPGIRYQRTTTESEFDRERVKGDPFDDPEDPLGVLDELLHSHVPLRF